MLKRLSDLPTLLWIDAQTCLQFVGLCVVVPLMIVASKLADVIIKNRSRVVFGCKSRGDAEIAYMTRYYLLKCRWFKVILHVFHRSDYDVMHDHPWWFWSLVLWGGYYEDTPRGRKWYSPGRLLWRPMRTIHRVVLRETSRGPRRAVTLLVTGRTQRQWYFYPPGQARVPWLSYFRRLGCE